MRASHLSILTQEASGVVISDRLRLSRQNIHSVFFRDAKNSGSFSL
nr:hypothetical protein [Nostoc sp. EkiNYC01]